MSGTKWSRPPYRMAKTPAGKPKVVYGAGDWSIATGADALPETCAALQLFAAAPDLYAALDAAADLLLVHHGECAAYLNAKQALAKADGEAT